MGTAPNDALVIITPIYEDIEASSRLFKELAASFNSQVYVVAVDDGSVRQPVDVANIEDVKLILQQLPDLAARSTALLC